MDGAPGDSPPDSDAEEVYEYDRDRFNKTKNEVYKFFTAKGDDERARCLLCRKKVKIQKHSSSAYTRHLKSCDEEKYNELERSKKKTSDSAVVCRRQSTMKEFASKFSAQIWLMIMIAAQVLPLSFVDAPEVRMFLAVANISTCSRSSLTRSVLPTLYFSVRNKIRSLLSKAHSIALTLDCWSTRTFGQSFLSLTAHLIIEDTDVVQQYCFALALAELVGSHTAVNLEQVIRRLTEYWGILEERICFITTDQGANLKLAITNVNERKWVACGCHRLHSAILRAIRNCKRIKQLLAKLQKLAVIYRKSPQLKVGLRQVCAQNNLPCLMPILAVTTRWNSYFNLVDRMLRIKVGISIQAATTAKKKLRAAFSSISDEEWAMADSLAQVLKPLAVVHTDWQSSRVPISEVLPVIKRKSDVLCAQAAQYSTSAVGAFAAELAKQIRVYFLTSTDARRKLTLPLGQKVATMLDPRFKKSDQLVPLEGQIDRESAVGFIVQTLTAIGHTRTPTATSPSTSAPKQAKTARAAELFGSVELSPGRVSMSTTPTTLEDHVRQELDEFLACSREDLSCDPIAYWSSIKTKHTHLRGAALYLLACPASSASSERLFSRANQVYSPLRSRTTGRTAEQLVIAGLGVRSLNYDFTVLTKQQAAVCTFMEIFKPEEEISVAEDDGGDDDEEDEMTLDQLRAQLLSAEDRSGDVSDTNDEVMHCLSSDSSADDSESDDD